MATTNDISPYLQRPVRTLEDAIAEVEQQRIGTPAMTLVIHPSKSGDPSSSDDVATSKEAV